MTCGDAFHAIKTEMPLATYGVSDDLSQPKVPKGCIFNVLENKLKFNSHITGGNGYIKNNRQVCTEKNTSNSNYDKELFGI